MSILQAFLLGIIQGLTEFLPVSSDGHLELGHILLDVHSHDNLKFAVVVHGATVLSTLIVFRKDIFSLLRGLFAFQWNEETRYISLLLISAIPVMIVGFFFREEVGALFNGNLALVGSMLMVTGVLLFITIFRKPGVAPINRIDALIIGVAQVLAVLPGLSRSGSTIATGLLLGKRKEDMARFSFLMVILPILGVNLLDLITAGSSPTPSGDDFWPLVVGFLAAFGAGLLACKWMINIVKKGKLIYFAIYCLIVGLIVICAG